MVNLTLYGDKISTCTQRVLILLEELELKYDFTKVNLMENKQSEKEYLELNPFGFVPVVKYDSHDIFESRSILRYISKNNNDYKDLTLDNSIDVDMWLEAESQSMSPIISKIVYEIMFRKIKEPGTMIDTKIINKEIINLKKVLCIYENRLNQSKYIGGDSFSIADISNIPCMYALVKCGYKSILKEFPTTYKWIKKLMSRESIKKVLESNNNYEYIEFEDKHRDEPGKSKHEHEKRKDIIKYRDDTSRK